jgi:hypothetical protein
MTILQKVKTRIFLIRKEYGRIPPRGGVGVPDKPMEEPAKPYQDDNRILEPSTDV